MNHQLEIIMQPFKDYYTLLKISQNATDEEISTAYRLQSLEWHPDRNPGLDTNKMMQEINEAKEVLLHPTRRKNYNQEYDIFKKNSNPQSHKISVDETVTKERNQSYWWLFFFSMSLLSRLMHGCNG